MSQFDDLMQYIKIEEPVILNVGANNGIETNLFLEKFPSGRVYAFEPEPRAIAKYKEYVKSPRSTLIEKAVGARDGFITFYQSSGLPSDLKPEDLPEGWHQSGSIRKPFRHLSAAPWVKFDTTIEVEMTTLDSWAEQANISSVDLIWADVQGAEEDLIRGAKNILTRTRFLYTEYSNEELYEGQLTLEHIINLVPNFKLVKDFGTDVLFENVNL